MANFSSVLDAPAPTTVERPKPYPVGSYLFLIKGVPEEGESSKKKTPFVEFTCQFLQAAEDVDPADLAEVLKGDRLTDKTMKNTFYLSEAAVWRLDKFLIEDLGIEGGHGRRAMLAQAPGRQFMGSIKHEPSEDGQNLFARLGNTWAVG